MADDHGLNLFIRQVDHYLPLRADSYNHVVHGSVAWGDVILVRNLDTQHLKLLGQLDSQVGRGLALKHWR
jgi:hypothetical protein